MAEPPPAAPAGSAGSEQAVLLATKLHVPGLQPGFVPRLRLGHVQFGGQQNIALGNGSPRRGRRRQFSHRRPKYQRVQLWPASLLGADILS